MSSRPRAPARAGSRSLPDIPIHGWSYEPSLIRLGTILATVCEGMANPTPANSPVPDRMAVFIPTTSPLMLSSGPPELPGLMAASVCMTSGIWNALSLDGRSLPSWLTIPDVMEPDRGPNGLPMAAMGSPTLRLDESPSRSGASRASPGESTRTTAMSV